MPLACRTPGGRPHRWVLAVVPCLLLAAGARGGAVQVGTAAGQPNQRTFNFDLSQIPLQKDLQSGITAALGLAFPVHMDQGGDEVTLSNPTLQQVTTPNPAIVVGADLRYRKTKGFPKISTKGNVEFSTPVVARVTMTDGIPPMLVRAELVLTDITVRKLRIKNVPKWLTDSDAVAGKIEEQIGKEKSFDLTPLLRKFIQQGGKLLNPRQ